MSRTGTNDWIHIGGLSDEAQLSRTQPRSRSGIPTRETMSSSAMTRVSAPRSPPEIVDYNYGIEGNFRSGEMVSYRRIVTTIGERIGRSAAGTGTGRRRPARPDRHRCILRSAGQHATISFRPG